MIITNLTYYQNQLISGQPLFTVETLFSAPEIVLYPHANELCKIMMTAMREVVERYKNKYNLHVLIYASLSFSLSLSLSLSSSTKKFPRWLDGSCIEAQPKQVPGEDEPRTFTFFTDVVQHADVNKIGGVVRDTILLGISNIVQYIGYWKKYRVLWRVQRVNYTQPLLVN